MTTTRNKLLDSGMKLFSKKGYLGTTTRDVATDAGIAEVTLFRHFRSKERLFEEVINRFSFLPALKDLIPHIAELSYEQSLIAIAEKFLESLAQRKDLIRIMHSEIAQYPKAIQKIYHALIDEILKTIALYFVQLQKKGILRVFDAEIAARAFLGMFFSYFNAENFLMRKTTGRMTRDRVLKEFVALFARGTMKCTSVRDNRKATHIHRSLPDQQEPLQGK